MGKKTINKKLQKKLYSIRNQKCCIPPTTKANDPGEYDGIDEYRDYRPTIVHVKIKDRVGKGKKLNKQKPWYYLTKKESITIENNRKQTKITHEEYIEAYLKDKLSKWEKKNPKPLENDIFYKEEYPKWVAEREAQHDKIVAFLNKKYIKKYTRPLIYNILESKHKESKEAYKKAAQSQDRHWDTILPQTGGSSSAKRRVVQFCGMDKSRDMEVVYPLSLIISESGVRIPLPQQLSLEVRKQSQIDCKQNSEIPWHTHCVKGGVR